MPPKFTALERIHVPRPRGDDSYCTTFLGREYRFLGLKALLGAADINKAGDRHAALAALTEVHREAARTILSELTLDHLYHHPLTNDCGEVDAVMRVNYDIDEDAFGAIAHLPLGELKDQVLRMPGDEVARLGFALTGVMAAALAKLCDVHELILLARKISRPSRARTQLGLPGTLSSRLQPNHPTDDRDGIALLTHWGLALGMGDALIATNPAVDTAENVGALLHRLDELRRKLDVPTQVCVLGHIKTQLLALAEGAPVEILFQSLAGTEAACTSEFDITIDLLDRGYEVMAERGPLAGQADQWMYFETGQGSEYSYGKHHGIDMTTTEALCYGLARRYDPFMVNNVTGFIGPETHLDGFEMVCASLQDHFMGKLLGLPMGMAPCYTLHSRITLESQQLATQVLTTAGANFYMDVALNTDRMLAYFDTSGHDVQTLRETYGKSPAPEFARWALDRGVYVQAGDGGLARGPAWGDVEGMVGSPQDLRRLLASTPPPHGFGTAGPRTDNSTARAARLHQAAARDAVHASLTVDDLVRELSLRSLGTLAATKEQHLDSPIDGALLDHESSARLCPEPHTVQVLISDGLSAEAVHHNVRDLLPVILDGLAARHITVGQPFIVRHGRVKLAEQVCQLTEARLVIHLIGERPGGDAHASRSLSAYFALRVPKDASVRARFEYSVLSNIYDRGLPAVEAGAVIVDKACAILRYEAAGNRLEGLLKRSPSTSPVGSSASACAT